VIELGLYFIVFGRGVTLNKNWWYSDRNGEVGPLSFDELVETFSVYPARQLDEVRIWRDGFDHWRGIRDVSEFARYAPELLKILVDRSGRGGDHPSTAAPHLQEISSNQEPGVRSAGHS